jgi:hypothetical protein
MSEWAEFTYHPDGHATTVLPLAPEDLWRYLLSPRMPVVYRGSIPYMWMSYVVFPQ